MSCNNLYKFKYFKFVISSGVFKTGDFTHREVGRNSFGDSFQISGLNSLSSVHASCS